MRQCALARDQAAPAARLSFGPGCKNFCICLMRRMRGGCMSAAQDGGNRGGRGGRGGGGHAGAAERRHRGPPCGRRATPSPTTRGFPDPADGFERWVLAGASMGLGYSQPSGAMPPPARRAGCSTTSHRAARLRALRSHGQVPGEDHDGDDALRAGAEGASEQAGLLRGRLHRGRGLGQGQRAFSGQLGVLQLRQGRPGLQLRRDATAGLPVVPCHRTRPTTTSSSSSIPRCAR